MLPPLRRRVLQKAPAELSLLSPPPRQAGEGTGGATEGKQRSAAAEPVRTHQEQEPRSAPTHLAHSRTGPGQNHAGV